MTTTMQDTLPSMEAFGFVDEVIPESGNPVSGDYTCQVCGKPLTYAGRGRKPKYCADHKASTSKGSGTTRKRSSSIDRGIDMLRLGYGALGMGLEKLNPIAGQVVSDSRNTLAESYRPLLETNTKLQKLLSEVESAAAWLPIIIAHGEVAMAINSAIRVQVAAPSPRVSDPIVDPYEGLPTYAADDIETIVQQYV